MPLVLPFAQFTSAIGAATPPPLHQVKRLKKLIRMVKQRMKYAGFTCSYVSNLTCKHINMSSSNLKALQQALNSSARPEQSVRQGQGNAVSREPSTPLPKSTGSYMAPSREGKTNITAYLSPDFKASLRLIQAHTGKSLQTLIAESLNDLFAKYNVPTVRQD